jgi:hypothetical protein
MFVSRECCVLCGRALCVGLITKHRKGKVMTRHRVEGPQGEKKLQLK